MKSVITLYLVIYYEHFPNIPNNYSAATFLFLIIQVMYIDCKKKQKKKQKSKN